MGTVGAFVQAFSVGLGLLRDHIKDPQRRLIAIQDYTDRMKKRAEEIFDEKDIEELDKSLLGFISDIHNI